MTLLSLVLNAAAHTNMAAFNVAPSADNSNAQISVFFGTYHSNSAASGAISLYKCSKANPTPADCATEQYGSTATSGIEHGASAELRLVPTRRVRSSR